MLFRTAGLWPAHDHEAGLAGGPEDQLRLGWVGTGFFSTGFS
jgi:hypothetical protein